jgi:GT2 family glycosyltransferase
VTRPPASGAVDPPADAVANGPADSPVHVVVVAYGPPAALAGALGALEGAFPVVVVDNGSSPDTAAVVARAGARYLDPGTNLGFTAAVNVALDMLRGRTGDVLLLNPDARIDAAGVGRLHALLHEEARLACVGPALVEPESRRPARSRWPWHTPLGAWLWAAGGEARRLDTARFFLGGAVLLLHREALAEVGAFDERFFLYGEDEDWQRRARMLGWRTRYCPEVVAEHGGGGTEDDLRRLRLRLHAATERYMRKWYGPAGWACYRAASVAGFGVRAIAGHGARRHAARVARLYLAGPDRAARRAGAFPPQGPAASL